MTGPARPPSSAGLDVGRVTVQGGSSAGDIASNSKMAHAMTNFAASSSASSTSLISPSHPSLVDIAKRCPTCGVHYPAEFKVCPRDATELEDAAAPEDRDDFVGQTLGTSYTIVRVIGEGGMGRVYEARHTRIGSKRFAIKMLHPEFSRQPEVISRFQREAEAAASIHSPYVVDVYDVDRSADGRPYIVGEFLEGKEFADYLDENGKMSVPQAVRIVRQICKALEAAHEKGVVHRDMKPENVFLTGDLTLPIAKVIDFGISKTGDTPGTALTKTGMIMGTPSYMAPEQARGERVDHRADIYAVGAILYCALTGQRPFDKGDPTATLTAVLTVDPPGPRTLEPSIPESLELIIQRAMAKQPAERYASMADLDAELAPYDTAEHEPLTLPNAGTGSFMSGAATITGTGRRVSASLDKQAREVALARPLILLMSTLGAFWVIGSSITTITAFVRLSRGGGATANLTGSEAVLLMLGVCFTLLTPLILGARFLRREVWGNSMKAVALSDRIRRPVVVALGAYGFAGLLVRLVESVILRRAAGVAWPVWDFILVGIGAVAAIASFRLFEGERKKG